MCNRSSCRSLALIALIIFGPKNYHNLDRAIGSTLKE
ncbi:hypothetical protein EDM39_14720, partial [Staphylococcus aureus]